MEHSPANSQPGTRRNEERDRTRTVRMKDRVVVRGSDGRSATLPGIQVSFSGRTGKIQTVKVKKVQEYNFKNNWPQLYK